MATRRRLLLLQLGAAVAAASCLLVASSCGPVDAALPPPSRDVVSATTDDTDVQSTVVDSGVAAVAAVSRGSRCLGPPARYLSDIPGDAPASDDIIPVDAQAPAASPAGNADDDPLTILRVFGFVLLFLFGGLLVFFFWVGLMMGAVGLVKGVNLLASAIADLYAAAREAREKATRVHPLDEDDAGH